MIRAAQKLLNPYSWKVYAALTRKPQPTRRIPECHSPYSCTKEFKTEGFHSKGVRSM